MGLILSVTNDTATLARRVIEQSAVIVKMKTMFCVTGTCNSDSAGYDFYYGLFMQEKYLMKTLYNIFGITIKVYLYSLEEIYSCLGIVSGNISYSWSLKKNTLI